MQKFATYHFPQVCAVIRMHCKLNKTKYLQNLKNDKMLSFKYNPIDIFEALLQDWSYSISNKVLIKVQNHNIYEQ